MKVYIKVSVKDRKSDALACVEIAGIIREALRTKGLYPGYDKSGPEWNGGYGFTFETIELEIKG